MKLYSEDNKLYEVLSKLGDYIILNILFLISCMPVITIGVACTAMYSVSNKMQKNESCKIVNEYFNAFKLNFKQATILWIFIAMALVVLVVDLKILEVYQNPILLGCIYGLFIFVFVITSMIFPLVAMFDNTTFMFIKNALVISFLNIGITLLVVLINCIPVIMLLLGGIFTLVGCFYYLLLGFAVSSMLSSKLLANVFKKYIVSNED